MSANCKCNCSEKDSKMEEILAKYEKDKSKARRACSQGDVNEFFCLFLHRHNHVHNTCRRLFSRQKEYN